MTFITQCSWEPPRPRRGRSETVEQKRLLRPKKLSTRSRRPLAPFPDPSNLHLSHLLRWQPSSYTAEPSHCRKAFGPARFGICLGFSNIRKSRRSHHSEPRQHAPGSVKSCTGSFLPLWKPDLGRGLVLGHAFCHLLQNDPKT